jgi:(4-(4-[2-(gamma-L-glutamylamino)ethyl]phenoxymethyl)furan-2-yl)methanamine synthase
LRNEHRKQDVMTAILGLDIGGANLKAAHTSGAAHTRPFALWKHPARLASELRSLRAAMPAHDRLALTMTGELCDCFASKRDGVVAILQSVEEAAAGTAVDVWTTRGTFVAPAEVCRHPLPAAAANWLALAHFAGRFTECEPALLMDVGSTTTDVVYLDQGKPSPRGLTDRQRLATGELVYTGVRRTPVCAVLGMGVAAEFFATMLDVYVWLGLWSENAHDTDTADGRPATREHAHARLARMVCADADEASPAEIDALAGRASQSHVDFVRAAVDRVLAERAAPHRLILSGSGEVLGRRVMATHPRLRDLPVISLTERLGPSLSEAACAYAVAMLAGEARREAQA